jgi:hypothetical protein
VALQDKMRESRLDAAHGQTIHSFHQILDPVRESLEEKERERRVYGDRPPDRGFRQKKTPRWLGGNCRRWIAAAGKERDFSESGTWLAGMNDKLTTAATADDAYPSLEHQSDSVGAIAGGPESFTCREFSLDRVLEQRIPARWTQAVEKLVSSFALAQWSVWRDLSV